MSLVAPAAVGNIGTNSRYLQQAGASPAVAIASVGATQIFVFASYLILVIVFGVITGQQQGPDLIPNTTVLLVAAGTVGVAALLLAVPATRRAIASRVRPMLSTTWPRLLESARQPRRIAMGIGGALLLNLSYAAALYAAVYAYGGDLAYATVGFVYLAAGAVGSAAPTPGGIGAVEAALAAGLDRGRPRRQHRGPGRAALPRRHLLDSDVSRLAELHATCNARAPSNPRKCEWRHSVTESLGAAGSRRLPRTWRSPADCARSTQNSLPSGSAITTHDSSPFCPISTREAPSDSSRATSASRSSGRRSRCRRFLTCLASGTRRKSRSGIRAVVTRRGDGDLVLVGEDHLPPQRLRPEVGQQLRVGAVDGEAVDPQRHRSIMRAATRRRIAAGQ